MPKLQRARCAHCRKQPRYIQAKGLCYTCWKDRSVRGQYPDSRMTRRPPCPLEDRAMRAGREWFAVLDELEANMHQPQTAELMQLQCDCAWLIWCLYGKGFFDSVQRLAAEGGGAEDGVRA